MRAARQEAWYLPCFWHIRWSCWIFENMGTLSVREGSGPSICIPSIYSKPSEGSLTETSLQLLHMWRFPGTSQVQCSRVCSCVLDSCAAAQALLKQTHFGVLVYFFDSTDSKSLMHLLGISVLSKVDWIVISKERPKHQTAARDTEPGRIDLWCPARAATEQWFTAVWHQLGVPTVGHLVSPGDVKLASRAVLCS